MSIQSQIALIVDGKAIDDNGVDEARQVFRAVCYKFRKWLSPVRQPASSWVADLSKMLILCRLESDPVIQAELLAVRAAAQVDSTIRPGRFGELIAAAGLDVLDASRTWIGDASDATARVRMYDETHSPAAEASSLIIRHPDFSIVVSNVTTPADIKVAHLVEAAEAIDAIAMRNAGGARNISLEYSEAPAYEGVLFDTVHDPWRPSTVFSSKLKAHPTKIIEPSTLAATPYPAATYRPILPTDAITRGMISDAQFEAITYALQATENYLPGSPSGNINERAPRGGFIIGDGTGVGKTNEACGVIVDQWARGRKRHIFVVEREKHYEHIQQAWEMLGGKARDIIWHGDFGAKDPIPDRDAVLVTSYALIRNDTRYASLLQWAMCQGRFEGVLAFDEAHNMRNAMSDLHEEGSSGKHNMSQQGIRGVELQEDLIDARVLYMSATMATDVYNLGYAPRLGLWGINAPFKNVAHFVAEMYELDEAALEQICIDLKSAGRYCSRNLSFDGVEYDEIEHRLTPAQRSQFDYAVGSWTKLYQMLDAANKICAGQNKQPKNSSHIRRLAVEQMLSTFNTDTLIDNIHEQLALGNAPVVQIAFTGEARLKRMSEGKVFIPEADYYDQTIINWVEEAFPTVHMTQIPGGWSVVKDAAGNTLPAPAAERLKQEALKLALEMSPRHGILDRLYMAFGKDMIAEMTGRSLRALPVMANGKLTGWNVEERSSNDAVADVKAFERDQKKILVFSLGAGGTGLSYHAAMAIKNQRRRVHYILELGNRAEASVQGLGRTHRSAQVSAPIVKLVRSDVPAHMIYASRTLEKISKMGALSRGHQHATTNAIFDQRVPLSGLYAHQGWEKTLQEVVDGKIDGMTLESLNRDLSLGGGKGPDSVFNLETALKRLAIMTSGDQRKLMERLIYNAEDAITTAIRQGTYNQGLETIRATSIEIVDEKQIRNTNGSMTTYYRLRKREEIERVPFRKAAMMAAAVRQKRSSRAVFMRHKVNGRIMLGVMRDNESQLVDIITPAGQTTRSREMLKAEPIKLMLDMEEVERLWNKEAENLDMREISDLHILSGSLLYNWDKLPKTGIGLNRCQTDDGQILVGRIIQAGDLRKTLQGLGMQSNYRPAAIAQFLSKVDQGATIDIDNGWKIVAPYSVGGDYRLLIPDAEQTGKLIGDLTSIGVVTVATPLGQDIEIPRAHALEIVQQIAIGSELNLKGKTTQHGQMAPAANSPMPVSLAACK